MLVPPLIVDDRSHCSVVGVMLFVALVVRYHRRIACVVSECAVNTLPRRSDLLQHFALLSIVPGVAGMSMSMWQRQSDTAIFIVVVLVCVCICVVGVVALVCAPKASATRDGYSSDGVV